MRNTLVYICTRRGSCDALSSIPDKLYNYWPISVKPGSFSSATDQNNVTDHKFHQQHHRICKLHPFL